MYKGRSFFILCKWPVYLLFHNRLFWSSSYKYRYWLYLGDDSISWMSIITAKWHLFVLRIRRRAVRAHINKDSWSYPNDEESYKAVFIRYSFFILGLFLCLYFVLCILISMDDDDQVTLYPISLSHRELNRKRKKKKINASFFPLLNMFEIENRNMNLQLTFVLYSTNWQSSCILVWKP